MSSVRRVYVEKKAPFAVKAKELKHEISSYLGIDTVTSVRELIRYDVENISDETFARACTSVFAELPVDVLYEEHFPGEDGAYVFSVEFLPTVRPAGRYCCSVRTVSERRRAAGDQDSGHLCNRRNTDR